MLMLVKFTIQVPWTQAEYLYGLVLSHRLFTMQVTGGGGGGGCSTLGVLASDSNSGLALLPLDFSLTSPRWPTLPR